MTDTPQFTTTIATITDHTTTPPGFIAVDANGVAIATTITDPNLVTAITTAIADYKALNIPSTEPEPEDDTDVEPDTGNPARLNPADYAEPAPGDRNPTNAEVCVLATHSATIDPEAFRAWWEAHATDAPAPNPHTDPIAVGQYLTDTNQD